MTRLGLGLGIRPARAAGGGAVLTPLDGLVAYWSLEEAPPGPWVDEVSGIELTNPTEATVNQVPGVVGNGLNFPLNHGELRAFDPVLTDPGGVLCFGAGSWSLMAWYQPSFDSALVVHKRSEFAYSIWADRGRTRLIVGDGAGTTETLSWVGEPVAFGSYNMLLAVWDGSDITWYINAETPQVFTPTVNLGQGSDYFAVAGTPSSNLGNIDEVAKWNRALTPGEVAFLYNGGAGRPFAELGDYAP